LEAARCARWSTLWMAGELCAAFGATLAADRGLKRPTVTDDGGIVTQLVLSYAATRREAA